MLPGGLTMDTSHRRDGTVDNDGTRARHEASDPAAPQASNDPGRHETEAQRLDRNLSELVQELRVAGLGVQVLFGFLLSLPFTVRFVRLSSGQRAIYLTDVGLATLAIMFLVAPVAYHRIVFRTHEKGRLVRTANVMALLGLVAVALAIAGAVLLIMSFVVGGAAAVPISLAVAFGFAMLWFALPMESRRVHEGKASKSGLSQRGINSC